MNWFKHYANADKDSRLQRLKTDYGFWGMGVYWSILERVVCYGEGCYPRNELMGLKQNRRDTGVIKAVLDRYELFQTDEFGMVRCIRSVQQSGTFVPENDKNVHECGTEVGTLCTDSKVGEKKEITENKEDTSDSLAYTHVEEKREEKNREEKNPSNSPMEGMMSDELQATSDECNPQGSLVTRSSSLIAEKVIHELRTNRAWQEAVCMTSGYGALLMRHFDHAIDIFLQHVKAGADEVELTDRRRAMNYFRNFTRLSHPAGKRLKEELEKRDKSDELQVTSYECHPDGKLVACSSSLITESPFEDPPGPNGERSYHGGRPLPPDAPPRPSPQAEWDEAEEKWLMIYDL